MRACLLCLLLAACGGGKVTAAALSATANVVESGGDKHSCHIFEPMAWVEKLAN